MDGWISANRQQQNIFDNPVYLVYLAQSTAKGTLSAQHMIQPFLPEYQGITQANTCPINPLLSEFKMEKQSTSEEENALRGT